MFSTCPEEKGIETRCRKSFSVTVGSSALALKKKGLRPCRWWHFRRAGTFSTCPEEKGIETNQTGIVGGFRRFNTCPEEKGIETWYPGCNTRQFRRSAL